GVDLIDQYLEKLDWQVNENSNMAFSLQGLNNYLSSEISKIYWLNKIYPPEVRNAHSGGDFHIHDLNIISVYCVGWDLYDLLLQGFKGAPGKVESKPAKHFRTALGQIVNFFYTLQGEAAGAQAFSNFDTLLAPFIRYDNLDYLQVKQALQEFIFNINVPTRVGFQTPFTNVTLDLDVPSHYADQGVVIGGKIQDATYGEFQHEMDLFNRAFVEVMANGDAKGRVFTFPIPTYNITSDFNWDNPNLEGLWEMTAKYGVPYFSNFINSDMDPEDARSMCCRLRIDNRELVKRGGGLFGSNPLTGSIGVVTINLPRLGHLSSSEGDFMQRLEDLIDIASTSLEIKRKVLESFTDHNLYPYTKYYLAGMKQKFGEYWKNHFSTIGIVGMNEACVNLFGRDIGTEQGRLFALKVADFIRDKLVILQEKTGNNYNFEATPAEGTSYRMARLDKKRYPEIICANEEAYRQSHEPYYTNSSQLPVNYTDDIFEALDLQDDIQAKYTGGTVLHLFAGERVDDPVVIKRLVMKICNGYKIPYFTFSPTFSVCPGHGYLTGNHPQCPECSEITEVYSRVVGYLRPVAQWNNGKKEEFLQRKSFRVEKAVPDEELVADQVFRVRAAHAPSAEDGLPVKGDVREGMPSQV
ncbi:MAG TPA: ribonucleoside triphosphate reductase, partial [Desulfomonilia bacterium]|nr:ribonucleoside triphosphate reductase [Desulfomonilia bacterium]